MMFISKAVVDGKDQTKTYKDNDAYLTIYVKDELLCFATMSKKSESYGILKPLSGSVADKEYSFTWYYVNSYNDKQGASTLSLSIREESEMTLYELKIVTEELSVLLFRGAMVGNLDLATYF